MFINLTHNPITEIALDAYKFRVLVLCPYLTADDLIEPDDEHEGYRTFLYSMEGDTVFIVIVNLMIGGVPRICELSSIGDRILEYKETIEFLANVKGLNISVSADHQPVIMDGVRDAVSEALQTQVGPAHMSHYSDIEESPSTAWADVELIARTVYNIKS